MNKVNKTRIPFIYTSTLYLAGLLLFLEWLYPVDQVTDTTFIGVFIIYAFFCFFITLLQVKWWLSILLKGFGIFFILNGLYSVNSFWSVLWFQEIYTELIYNIQVLFARQWFDLSNMFRTLMFLFIIWLMSYLVYYWFVQVKRVLIFSVLTFIYITLLDTFTVYNADWAIFRTFVIAFLALGLANVLKEIQNENIQTYRLNTRPLWILPLVAVVLFSSMVGYAAPKLEPQWADPVPYFEGVINGNGSGGAGLIQKVGYGENDSRLGGSFVQDYTPVFNAYMQEDNYFRIESKDYYTGKGWVNSEQIDHLEQVDWDIQFETFTDRVETEERSMTLEFDEKAYISKLLYPYGIKNVIAPDGEVQLKLREDNGEILTVVDDQNIILSNYMITYDKPSYPIELMRQSAQPTDEKLMEQYTRIPATLPSRVGDLAREITDSYDNQYDKVRAIERYFSANGFEYQIEDVAVPSEDQDYVDQFLFETKVGYCDNFSTSMVVMLRTLDIPARWVKGFSSGVKVEDNVNSEGQDLYEITNANAHSWVEVYFEGVGWVPFEPTQGFNVPNSYSVDTSTDDAIEVPDVETPTPPEQDLQTPEEVEDAFSPSGAEEGNPFFEFKLVHFIILVVILVIGILLTYWKRNQIRSYLIERRLIKRKDAESYQDAFHFVLKLLKNKGFKKEPDQTLREFAVRIDNWYGSDEMGKLTANYEKLIYQHNITHTVDDEISNLWKNLIKRILG
ncbi:transglutaminase domain-containing protein [Ornithinibacillus sp. 179-J 7C1 HS]|uniref:transglutaminase domain-containing protein n=1 Tax=Ornithinibacillus sp. 179-J 7C1 HS TaxID=3142384 RepID=UPI0039A003EF